MKDTFPHFHETMVTVPISFQYNLGSQHGLPSRAKEIREKKLEEEKEKYELGKRKATSAEGDNKMCGKQTKKAKQNESELIHSWEKAASGQFAEQRVYEILQKRFSNEPCLLVHEFKENDLLKVMRENFAQERRDSKSKQNNSISENSLTEREFQFSKLTNRHFIELEKNIVKMMETLTGEVDLPKLLKTIQEYKPGYNLQTENNKKNYMKNIENFLSKKFKEGFHSNDQLKDLILEHFLNLTYPNSEYDLLLFLKVCAIIYL